MILIIDYDSQMIHVCIHTLRAYFHTNNEYNICLFWICLR